MNAKNIRLVFSFLIVGIIGLLIICNGCKQKSTIDWNMLIKEYSTNPEDSLKLEAVLYLQDNMVGMTSELLGIRNAKDDSVLFLKDIDYSANNIDSLKKLFTGNEYLKVKETLKDEAFLTTEKVRETIESAYKDWRQNIWGKDVPKQIFFDYLLPYKIFEEYPSDWRKILSSSMTADLANWKKKNTIQYDTNRLVYIDTLVNKFVLPQSEKWYKYSLDRPSIGKIPSFSEIALFKDGDCFSEAAINTYLIRAIGIPAGFDFVPHWGNGNGAHATAVYWNSGQQKMRLLFGLDLGAPKVFRRIFKNTKMWDQQIGPIIGKFPFELDFLKSNHLLDVTSEHIITSEINLKVPEDYDYPFAYICVYNYEKWMPVFWAKIDNNHAVFKSMGRGIIYRLKLPSENGEPSYGKPFLLTVSNKIVYPSISSSKIDMTLKSINNGKEAYVKANSSYLLNYLDAMGEWVPIQQKKCLADSILEFKNVQSATFYKLSDQTRNKYLSRIFSYKGGKQVWY